MADDGNSHTVAAPPELDRRTFLTVVGGVAGGLLMPVIG